MLRKALSGFQRHGRLQLVHHERGHLDQVLLLLLFVSVIAGCQSKEGITTYYTETEAPTIGGTSTSQAGDNQSVANAGSNAEAPVKAAPLKNRGKPTDRMVAAIIPTETQAWFLKVVGPSEKVDEVKPMIDEFFARVVIEAGKPTWDLPGGWQVGPEKTMRLATLLIPTSDSDSTESSHQPLELSIIGLPLTGDWSNQLLSNVNRWRGQLGRDPLTASLLEEMTTPLEIAEGAIRFDSTGWFSDGGMSSGGQAPFAGGAPFSKRIQQTPTKPQQGGTSNSMANAPAVPVGSGELKQTPPEGWTNLPGSAMRKASLSTPDGATVTAFVFPATAPAMADPLANVNRWRGEIGLGPTTDEALAISSEELSLAGGKATYVELVGETETTLAAMSPRGDQVWFFKLRGPNPAAEAQRDAFKQWLASIEL